MKHMPKSPRWRLCPLVIVPQYSFCLRVSELYQSVTGQEKNKEKEFGDELPENKEVLGKRAIDMQSIFFVGLQADTTTKESKMQDTKAAVEHVGVMSQYSSAHLRYSPLRRLREVQKLMNLARMRRFHLLSLHV